MKHINFSLALLNIGIFIFPNFTYANQNNDFKIVSEKVKYYKTIIYKENNLYYSLNNTNSDTIEVSQQEYDNASLQSKISRSNYSDIVETNYKKMTTTISSNGSYYRYKVVLNWKNIPSTRSYDIIGIGFLGSVKVKSSLNFTQEYCTSVSNCTTSNTNYPQVFSSGAGTTFKLPSGTLTSLKQTLYFDVEKNTTNTIVMQDAYGDYAHATSSISLTNAKKYTMLPSVGISLNSNVSSYYDTIDYARAHWEGSW